MSMVDDGLTVALVDKDLSILYYHMWPGLHLTA